MTKNMTHQKLCRHLSGWKHYQHESIEPEPVYIKAIAVGAMVMMIFAAVLLSANAIDKQVAYRQSHPFYLQNK